MFTDVEMEEYDLKNDLHKAEFFRNCLKDDLVFSVLEDNHLNWRSTGYEGIITPEISVKRVGELVKFDIKYIEDLLLFIMSWAFDEATKLIKMHQHQTKLWTEKRDEEFEKIEKEIGYVAGETKRNEWLENNPFKFSENIDIKVLIAFKEHFSTEHNILMALRHLSMILFSVFD
tara:strand:+ start:2401 stop:2922 length:522 start_codon:yes stop_codon:yes gene_type:complete